MISTVKIYKDSKILDGKNFIVDDIESYLSTLTGTITITGFQYIKHAFNIFIKIDKSQTYLNFDSDDDFNYISIRNMQDDGSYPEKLVYYFVEKMVWTSESTIRFDLVMDTLNTFRAGTDFELSDKTIIQREHRDRYKVVSAGTSVTKTITTYTYCMTEDHGSFYSDILVKTGGSNVVVNTISSNGTITQGTISGGTIPLHVEYSDPFTRINIAINVTYDIAGTYQRIIDPVSEGMQSILFKDKDQDIIDNVDMRWYLVYKNNTAINPDEFNPQNPIDVYLYTDKTLPIRQYGDIVIHAADLNASEYLEINCQNNPDAGNDILISYHNQLENRDESISIYQYYADNEERFQGALIYKSGTDLYICKIFSVHRNGWLYYYSTSIQVSNAGVLISYSGQVNAYSGTYTGDPTDPETLLSIPYATTSNETLTGTYTDGSINCDIKLLDRTDSTLIKIIMLPYCPVNFNYANNRYIIDSKWDVSGDKLKMNDLNMDFENIIETSIESPLAELYLKQFTPNTASSRNDDNESKLLHSDYYSNKIVYDSFVYDIALENIKETDPEFNQVSVQSFIVDWNTTNTMQSRFLARFPQVKLKRSTQAFDNILYINRNNEMSIFNSPYFNYIRTGYNYDVKDKQMALEQADENLQFQAMKWGVDVAKAGVGAIASGNVMGLASSFGSGAMSMLQTISNNAYMAMRLDSGIMRNLATARNTAISVSAADDVNLLLKYCPVAKCITYKASDLFKKSMADLFYYCGYSRNIQGKPNETSRYWFNFVSARLKFDTTINIPNDCLNDIVAKYDEGVTRLHHHTTWDFDQKKENWEVSLL